MDGELRELDCLWPFERLGFKSFDDLYPVFLIVLLSCAVVF